MSDPTVNPNRLNPTGLGPVVSQPASDATRPDVTGPNPPGATWQAPPWLPVVVLCLGGALSAALPFATGPTLVALTVAIGVLTSAGAALGIKSGGAPRR